jgi:uncharacterized damage-inducible protein DinB
MKENMKAFFMKLFEYNHHCNQTITTAFVNESDRISQKAHNLYCHLLNAHQIWNNRMMPLQPLFGVWDVHSIETRADIDAENYRHTLKILTELDLVNRVSYATFKGQKFDNSVQDILFHIINHSTYHRGQIAVEFRNSGIEPINTDYIFYKR